jgi:hypothetical protein
MNKMTLLSKMSNDSFLIALTDDVISYFYPFSIDIALVYTSTCSEAAPVWFP